MSTPPKPLSPREAKDKFDENHAPEVIQAINELLVERYSGRITIKQDEIIEKAHAILKKNGGTESMSVYRKRLFEKHKLDIEDVYRKAGWSVVYDKPGYNEGYSAFFEFSTKDREA